MNRQLVNSKLSNSSTKKESRKNPSSSSFKIFVGGLPSNATAYKLQAYFSQFGNIKKCSPKMWSNSPKRCKGFAILFLKDKITYERILDSSSHVFQGREIQCKKVLPKSKLAKYSQELNSKKVFIKGVPKRAKNSDIKSLFEKIGKVEIAYIVKDRKSKNPLGFGYVIFEDKKSRDLAVAQKTFILFNKSLTCFEYDSKKYEEKKESLNNSPTKTRNTEPSIRSSPRKIKGFTKKINLCLQTQAQGKMGSEKKERDQNPRKVKKMSMEVTLNSFKGSLSKSISPNFSQNSVGSQNKNQVSLTSPKSPKCSLGESVKSCVRGFEHLPSSLRNQNNRKPMSHLTSFSNYRFNRASTSHKNQSSTCPGQAVRLAKSGSIKATRFFDKYQYKPTGVYSMF